MQTAVSSRNRNRTTLIAVGAVCFVLGFIVSQIFTQVTFDSNRAMYQQITDQAVTTVLEGSQGIANENHATYQEMVDAAVDNVISALPEMPDALTPEQFQEALDAAVAEVREGALRAPVWMMLERIGGALGL